jgi:pyruvate kinase
MTKIVASIGPACLNKETLKYFVSHHVEIARMNFSHNTSDWHFQSSLIARDAGLKLLFDLQGPKIRLGDVNENVVVKSGQKILLEQQKVDQFYPYNRELAGGEYQTFPFYFPVNKFVNPGDTILVDDGKVEWKVIEVIDEKVICEVIYGGIIKSRKGMNMPDSNLEVDFLQERDLQFLEDLFVKLQPEYVAASFVKTKDDILFLKGILQDHLDKAGITDYFPKVCAKLEMSEAVNETNLPEIVAECDIVMIARGDLALETYPTHINVPFIQAAIEAECKKQNKPFIVATQILESMCENPVPTRAEVSDLYRAVITDKADYVMLSGESAAGAFPERCIKLMSDMIEKSKVKSEEHFLTPQIQMVR